MPKKDLKTKVAKNQNGDCTFSGKKLPDKTRLYDAHREIPKRKGGELTLENTSTALPIHHMGKHGILRERNEELKKLKMIIDDRQQVSKITYKIENQLLACKRRTDYLSENTTSWLEKQKEEVASKLREIDRNLIKTIRNMDNPLVVAALGVRGIGPVTVAYCLVYLDLSKARHASSTWKYTGLHAPNHERYKKGESSGGNKNLRTVLYTMADSQMKVKGAYRYIYDRVKSRLEVSDKITTSRNTQGKLVQIAWKDTKPCHRHGAALRAVMKHFLADYWFVGRTLEGLETSPGYAEAVLGKGHKTIAPEERGWIY
jgi:hypothetical protein